MSHWCRQCEYAKDSHPAHAADCRMATLADIQRHVAMKDQRLSAQWSRVHNLQRDIRRAQGRCAVLRHENNKLRKANERLRERLGLTVEEKA